VGKTSLLRDGEAEARQLGFLTAWVACSRQKPFMPDVISRVSRAVDRWDAAPAEERARLRVTLESVSTQVGTSGAEIASNVTSTAPDAPDNARMSVVEDLLHETSATIRRVGGAGLVLFIDEIHTAHLDDLSVLLNAVQLLEGARKENPLTVIAAGLPSTPRWVTKAATFGERSEFMTVERLDRPATRDALTGPAAESGVTWSNDALDAVAAEVDGFPYLLHVFAHATWQAAEPTRRGDLISAGHVRTAYPETQRHLEALYSARWDVASPVERKIIHAMAVHASKEVPRAAVAKTTGMDTRRLSIPRERLIDKGIIEAAGYGLLRFTMSGFGNYVMERHKHDA
jgi:hypothetical protein